MTSQKVRPRPRHRALLALLLAAVAVILAACGSSHGSSSSTTAGASAGATTGSGSSSTPASFKLLHSGELTVGMDLQFKPEMYLQNGKPAGYDVALLDLLAKSLHAKLNIQNLDFNGLIPGLQANKYDLVSVGLSPTPQREQVISFTRAYVPYAQVLGVPAKDAKSVTSTTDIDKSGNTITALQGSTDQQLAQQVFKHATVTGYPDQSSAFLQVATGRAQGVVAEDYLLAEYAQSNPGQIAQADLAKPLQVQYGSWATPKGHTAFIDYLDKWLCTQQNDGTLKKLYEQTEGVKSFPTMPSCPA